MADDFQSSPLCAIRSNKTVPIRYDLHSRIPNHAMVHLDSNCWPVLWPTLCAGFVEPTYDFGFT